MFLWSSRPNYWFVGLIINSLTASFRLVRNETSKLQKCQHWDCGKYPKLDILLEPTFLNTAAIVIYIILLYAFRTIIALLDVVLYQEFKSHYLTNHTRVQSLRSVWHSILREMFIWSSSASTLLSQFHNGKSIFYLHIQL